MPLDLAAVRAQFPALSITDDGMPRIYFDNPAGTQVPTRVVERMTDALVRYKANTGGVFRTTREATALIDEAHAAMADFVNAASPREIVFGANMTTLTFMMTRVLGPRFEPGDELITTAMEHDGNATPWITMAHERGMVVKRLPFDRSTYEFDLDALDELITERTRFAAINVSSNILGTINDVAEICRRVRAVGGLTYLDAVQYAPHGPIDVQAFGCDFLVCSAYKFYGPHQGILYGRGELLDELPAYRLEAAPAVPPGKFETGTQSLEGQAGVLGAVEYLQWVGTTMGQEHLDDPASAGLRDRTRQIHAAFRAMAAYEEGISERLIAGLQRIDGVTVHGITNPERFDRRVPTVSFTRDGMRPRDMSTYLAENNVFVWDGASYALPVIGHLGLGERGGVVRLGPTHYNTLDEVDRVLELIADFAGA